jgi:hypothetical protein
MNSKLVVAAIAARGRTARQAYAQDPGDEEGGVEAEGSVDAGDGTVEGEGSVAVTTPDADMDGAVMEGIAGYPQAVIDRPGVLPKGVLEITADLPILVKPSPVSLALGIGARYGLAPKIDAQISYAFALKEFEIKGDLGLGLQYDLATNDKMRAALRVTTGLDLNGFDAATGDSKVQFNGIGLGVNFQYKLTPKVAVFTPGNQLTMGGADFPKPVAINLPIGFGFQASPELWAWASTSIGTFGLSPSGNVLISDITPASIGASFSPSNKMDVGASLDFFDLQHAGDFLAISLHAALRM